MQAYKQLEKIFADLSHLEHLGAMANWDEAVMMPIGGGTARAEALAALQRLQHEKLTENKVKDLLHAAQSEKLTDLWQRSNLNWMQRAYDNASCLPSELVEQLSHARSSCEQVWRIDRAQNNWSHFLPYLEKVVALVRTSARMRAEKFNKAPYDVLIDDFSEGITSKFIDPIFAKLKAVLPNLINEIIEHQKSSPLAEFKGPFAIAQQKELGLRLMQAIGFNFDHGRLDVSHHPFCGGVPQDVRLTTRYSEQEFITSAMGVCHETGHARYEQNLPRDWINQPVGRVHSMTLHESQSLLIEMQVCRSPEFMHFLAPLINQYFGEHKNFTAENLYRHYTHVKKQFIRVDADEVTYPLHVIARYEIEKALIGGEIECRDLPDIWAEKMSAYLGLDTKNNFKDGVMQDVHWPSGAFGYFPAYTLGSLTGAQLFAHAKKTFPDVLTRIKHGDFSHLYNWLIPNFQAHASSLSFDDLMKVSTGETLNPEYFLNHINTRYLD